MSADCKNFHRHMSSEYAHTIFSKNSNFLRHLNNIFFSGFTFSEKQNKHIFRKKNKLLSYTRIRDTIFSALEKIVYQSKNLGYIAFVPGVQQQLSIQSYQTDCSNEMAMGIPKCKRWLLYYG